MPNTNKTNERPYSMKKGIKCILVMYCVCICICNFQLYMGRGPKDYNESTEY